MDITSAVAANARAVREQKKLTLDAAAEITGVSRSMLAQIEKGDVNPTISVLWKIANGYKVSFTSLIESRGGDTSVIRAGDTRPLSEDGGRYVNYPTFAFDEQKLFECYRILIQEGGFLAAQPHLKGSEEYITVFSGDAEITIGGETHRLSKGDSIRFRADVPHAYRNAGSGSAELSMLIYYNK
ncbi:MAG: helix-turn-helix transcriptional regulator [Clostridia bacterium]|nr:helix-turn-helix transcriptional regulator [Clostridia bacterium]